MAVFSFSLIKRGLGPKLMRKVGGFYVFLQRGLGPKLMRKVGGCQLHTCPSMCASSDDIRNWLASAEGGKVDITKDDMSGLAVLTLNNPERLNAITGAMMVQLADIVTDLKEWKNGKALIVHGEGRTFCSGGDLNMVRNMLDKREGGKISTFMHRTLTELNSLPLISVATIDGPAVGGGAELCTATDFRVMTEQSQIRFVQVLLGIVPGWGGSTRLTRLVGRTRALEVLSSGRAVSPEEALEIGLANWIIPSGHDVVEATAEWLKKYMKGKAEVVRAVKNGVVAGSELSMEEALQKEREQFMNVWGGPAHVEALSRNKQKK